MKDIVYQQIRNEMTNLFSSFRYLQAAQYVSVLGLISVIFGLNKCKADQIHCLQIGIILSGLLILFSYLGGKWHSHATRLGAYLLVAHDIPGFLKNINSNITDMSDYWILANRAESYKKRKITFLNKHSFRTDLKMLYFQQAVFSICFASVIFFYVNPFWGNPGFPKIRYIFVLILLVIEFIIFLYKSIKKDDFGEQDILNWKNYVDNRINYDKEFLNKYGYYFMPPSD